MPRPTDITGTETCGEHIVCHSTQGASSLSNSLSTCARQSTSTICPSPMQRPRHDWRGRSQRMGFSVPPRALLHYVNAHNERAIGVSHTHEHTKCLGKCVLCYVPRPHQANVLECNLYTKASSWARQGTINVSRRAFFTHMQSEAPFSAVFHFASPGGAADPIAVHPNTQRFLECHSREHPSEVRG